MDGEPRNFYITNCEALSNCYIRIHAQTNSTSARKVQQLLGHLKTFLDGKELPLGYEDIRENELYVGKKSDEDWYRIRVLRKRPRDYNVLVKYIDLGNEEVLDFRRIRVSVPAMNCAPPLADEYILADAILVTPLDRAVWSAAAKELTFNLCMGTVCGQTPNGLPIVRLQLGRSNPKIGEQPVSTFLWNQMVVTPAIVPGQESVGLPPVFPLQPNPNYFAADSEQPHDPRHAMNFLPPPNNAPINPIVWNATEAIPEQSSRFSKDKNGWNLNPTITGTSSGTGARLEEDEAVIGWGPTVGHRTRDRHPKASQSYPVQKDRKEPGSINGMEVSGHNNNQKRTSAKYEANVRAEASQMKPRSPEVAPEYQEPSPKADLFYAVERVDHVVAFNEFYLKLKDKSQDLHTFQERAKKSFEGLKRLDATSKGQICMVLMDKLWKRGISRGKDGIDLVDFGVTVPRKEVTDCRAIEWELVKKWPKMSIKCTLEIKGFDKRLSYNRTTIEAFNRVLKGKQLLANFKDRVQGTDKWVVVLYEFNPLTKGWDLLDCSSLVIPAALSVAFNVKTKAILTQPSNPFYCQLMSEQEKFKQMGLKMQEYYNTIKGLVGKNDRRVTLSMLKPGVVVAACFSEDKCWYRAQVTSVSKDGKCGVIYIDYGNAEIITCNEMRQLYYTFEDLTPQAFKCSLKEGQSWPPSFSNTYLKEIECTFNRYDDATSCYIVTLPPSLVESAERDKHQTKAEKRDAEPSKVCDTKNLLSSENFSGLEQEEEKLIDFWTRSVAGESSRGSTSGANESIINQLAEDLTDDLRHFISDLCDKVVEREEAEMRELQEKENLAVYVHDLINLVETSSEMEVKKCSTDSVSRLETKSSSETTSEFYERLDSMEAQEKKASRERSQSQGEAEMDEEVADSGGGEAVEAFAWKLGDEVISEAILEAAHLLEDSFCR